jgi:hypothetical protein
VDLTQEAKASLLETLTANDPTVKEAISNAADGLTVVVALVIMKVPSNQVTQKRDDDP